MNEELKTQGIQKMLKEMESKHSPAIDKIHNWLCDQDDEELYTCIVKEEKTIAGAYKFAENKARKEAVNNCACVDADTVFGWVREYFTTATTVEPAKTSSKKAAAEEIEDDGDEPDPEVEAGIKAAQAKKAAKKAEKIAAVAAAKKIEEQKARDAAERKAAHAPANQTSIFDFTE